VVLLFQNSEIFIAKTQSQRQVRSRFPIVADEETVTVRTEVTLCICWATRHGICVDLVEQRRIVGKVKETGESIKRTRSAVQVIVIKLTPKLATEFKTMITPHIADHVAKLHRFFRENSRRGFRLVGAEADAAAVSQ